MSDIQTARRNEREPSRQTLYLCKLGTAWNGTFTPIMRSWLRAVHLALTFGWTLLLAMKRTKHKTGLRAILFGLTALAISACASAPAPGVYANRGPLPAIQPHSQARTPLDLTTTPFDADTAPRILYGEPPSQCVPYARAISGIDIRGDAVTWWSQADGRYPRSSHPAEGAVLVLRGYNDHTRGHVSVVREVVSDRLLRVDHANWMNGGEISVDVPVIDVSPNNDWSEVRVWYIPGAYWGGRTYQAEGFIHPIGRSQPLVAGSSATG